MLIISKNRKVRFDYFIIQRYIAGLSSRGWQVKSIKQKNFSIKEAYCYVKESEIFLKNMTITPVKGLEERDKHSNVEIKLLLSRKEIDEISGLLGRKGEGTTLVPYVIGPERGLIKVEICLVKGKKKYDKRNKIDYKQLGREIREIV